MRTNHSLWKKAFSAFLAVLMLVVSVPVSVVAEEGVPEGYIPVRTVEDLYNVRNDLTANYIMMNDIDLTEATAEGGDWDYMGNGWDPIGSGGVYGGNAFSGIFDGNGHSIIGMRIDVTTLPSGVGSSMYVGLFAKITGTVQNLNLIEGSVNVECAPYGYNYKLFMGSVSGYLSKAFVTNVYNNMCVTLDYSGRIPSIYLGGLFGFSYNTDSKATNSEIFNCFNEGSINVNAVMSYEKSYVYIGGILGSGLRDYIVQCGNNGDINVDIVASGAYINHVNSGFNDYIDGYHDGETYLFAGGIHGDTNGTGSINITESFNNGDILVNGSCINEHCREYSVYSYCYIRVYGISCRGTITNCYNAGDVITTGQTQSFQHSGYYYSKEYSYTYKGDFNTYGISGLSGAINTTCYNRGTALFRVVDVQNDLTESSVQGYGVGGSSASSNNYYLSGTGKSTTGAVSLSDAQMKLQSVYQGFNFVNTWMIEENSDYPYPQLQLNPHDPNRKVTSIKIITYPTDTVYSIGETPSFSGGQIEVTYISGKTEIIDITSDMVSGIDTSIEGWQTATVTYRGAETEFSVYISDYEMTGLMMLTTPSKLVYLEGDELDLTGMTVAATFSNNKTVVIPDCMITGYDSTPGTKTITVSYSGFSVSFEVTVEPKSIVSLSLTNEPTKLVYLEGDELDLTGAVVTAHYNNGTEEVVTDYIVSGYDSTPGTKTVTLTYDGVSTEFDVTVEAKTITDIEITSLPSKMVYPEGVDFDTTGLVITAYYNNGTKGEITDYEILGYDSTIGVKTVTIQKGEYSVSFDVVVTAKTLSSIAVTKTPLKTTYLEGDTFDSDGIEVTAYYNNGTSEVVTDYEITGYSSTPGEKTITVLYQNKVATFTVNVAAKSITEIAVTTKPSKMVYLEGDNFNTSGMVVTAYYDNGTEANVTGYTVTGYDNTPGSKLITVSYNGFSAYFTVTVQSRSMTGIEITEKPAKLTYLEGDELNTEGLSVSAIYNNGTSETVTGYTVFGYDSTPGTKTITVSYSGFTATFQVKVNAKSLTSVKLTKEPNKTVYLEGDSLDLTGTVLTAYYNNGTSTVVTNYTVSGYNSTPGTKTVTLTCGGKSVSFEVTVEAKSLTGIEVTSKPAKLAYVEGQELDTTGMTVTATYNNGTSEAVTDYTVSGYDSTPGTKTITVSYGGFTDTFTVEVIARSLTGITVTKNPDKTVYIEGQDFETEGLVVTAKYNDGTSETVTDYTASGYDSSVGTKTVTVTYQDKTATFTVEVIAREVTAVEITKLPGKNEYIEGEDLDLTGLEVTATYNDSTTEVLGSDKYTVEGFDTSVVGEQVITVTCNGKTHSFTVTVVKAIVYGDVTGDGKVNLGDVSLVLKYIARWDVTLDLDAADVTADGKVNLADVSLILKYIAKWDVVLGPTV